MLIVDANVLATALADGGADGELSRRRLSGERLAAPAVVDLEVASVWRRLARAGGMTEARVLQALADLRALPLLRVPHQAFLGRCWELRDNLSIYDAAYIAVAEAFEAPLVTGDDRLALAPGVRCPVEVLQWQDSRGEATQRVDGSETLDR
ncbi:MAG: type II toxin-antitoxin system VapC family toxin [Bifidobacteriaceae bacterium]|nr:type II toxin-antitoxin system VapC family toxin [Bifidobacteriaceae bacterium]